MNSFLHALACASLLLATAATGSATIIGFSSTAGGRTAVDVNLTPLDNGDQFLVGHFSSPGSISMSSGTVAGVLASGGWTQFNGAQTINFPLNGSIQGKLSGSATDTTPSANSFNGLNVYIVIFNTSSAATATQMGIFRAPSVTIGDPWVFPVNGSVSDSISLAMDDAAIAAIAGIGSVTASPQRFVLTTVIPEPSAFALLAPGLMGLLGFRRLHRRF